MSDYRDEYEAGDKKLYASEADESRPCHIPCPANDCSYRCELNKFNTHQCSCPYHGNY